MSGDVQPRKRKDKRKKRETLDARKSEDDLMFSRKSSLQDDEASHGVHITKMGSDDVHLHVHQEHGTGGHWCAKIIFFSLMTILLGLVCLIILENRGIQDVDTPLSESRFSNYFDGWVEEHRDDHDDHHDNHASMEHDDDHDDDHDEDDHDEDDHDEDDHDDDHDVDDEEEVDHSEGDELENVTPEEEDEDDNDNVTAETVTAEDNDDDDDDDDDDGDDEENNDGDDDVATAEDDEDDNATAENDEDENVTAENETEDDNATEEATIEQNYDDDDDDDGENNAKEDDDDDDDNVTAEASRFTSKDVQGEDDDDDPFEEDNEDGNFESIEKIVDNDAAELELLKEKAREQAAAESKQNVVSAENDLDDEAENAPSWASPQIRPKTGGGPQSLEDEELALFEQELRRANDQMMREFNYH